MNRRTEEYRRRLDVAGAQWFTNEPYTTTSIASFSDLDTEYNAVRNGLGIADRSERDTLVITGSDSVTWLQGLVTNDVFALAEEGSGQRTHAVNHIGRTIADMRIVHLMDMLIVDLETGNLSDGFLKHLKQHVIMEDVKLADRSLYTNRIALFGQHAPSKLEALAECRDVPRTLRVYGGTVGTIAGHDVIIQRIPWTGEWGFEIFVDRDAAGEVWDALMSLDPTPVGAQALEILRQEAGEVRFRVEYNEKTIPIEADLNDTIDYDKGCYLGQEIIHRLDTRGTPAKMLRLVIGQDPKYVMNTKQLIKIGGKKVGVLQNVFHSPKLGQLVGVAYLKRGANDPGTDVEVETPQGLFPAKVEAIGYPLKSNR